MYRSRSRHTSALSWATKELGYAQGTFLGILSMSLVVQFLMQPVGAWFVSKVDMRRAMCWSCGARQPMEDALARVRAGEDDPACRLCGGILKSDTISFGQALVPAVIDRAMQAAAEADLMLAIGSTLQVYPAAGVVPGEQPLHLGAVDDPGQP